MSGSETGDLAFALDVDYGPWAGRPPVHVSVSMPPDARPSAGVLASYGLDHPGHATPLDVLVQWSEEADVPLGFEPDAPIVRDVDGVGHPVDSQLPPWWCHAVDGAKATESAAQASVRSGAVVRFFFGDCGGPG